MGPPWVKKHIVGEYFPSFMMGLFCYCYKFFNFMSLASNGLKKMLQISKTFWNWLTMSGICFFLICRWTTKWVCEVKKQKHMQKLRQTQSWGSVWRLLLLSGCICPCTGACPDSWSGCFFPCSRWALYQTSEEGIAPLDAETITPKGSERGRKRDMRHTELRTNLSDLFLSTVQTGLQHCTLTKQREHSVQAQSPTYVSLFCNWELW